MTGFARRLGDMVSDLCVLSDVCRLRAFLSLGDLELYLVTLLQAFVALGRNRAVMNEHIRSILAADEPITFGVIEPLHGTFHTIHLRASKTGTLCHDACLPRLPILMRVFPECQEFPTRETLYLGGFQQLWKWCFNHKTPAMVLPSRMVPRAIFCTTSDKEKSRTRIDSSSSGCAFPRRRSWAR